MFQSVNFLSKPQEKSYLESLEKAQDVNSFFSPKNFLIHFPVLSDHNLIDLSQEEESTKFPS